MLSYSMLEANAADNHIDAATVSYWNMTLYQWGFAEHAEHKFLQYSVENGLQNWYRFLRALPRWSRACTARPIKKKD
jgi:hypothetical protein